MAGNSFFLLKVNLTDSTVWNTGETVDISSWLSRCSTARGTVTGSSFVGPPKVKDFKSFLISIY